MSHPTPTTPTPDTQAAIQFWGDDPADATPPEPLTPAERVLLVAIVLGSALIVIVGAGYAWQRWLRWWWL